MTEALSKVQDALSSIRLVDLQVEPQVVGRGSKLTLIYAIESELDVPLEVWLGANLRNSSGAMIYDSGEDKVVTLEPGRHIHTRYLTVGALATPGTYDLLVEVWFGKRSDPDRSIAVTHMWPARNSTIMVT